MPMTYFDCQEPFDHRDMADLDRVYRLNWDSFTEAHWQQLDAIYKQLPGWCGYDQVPWWFGKDDGVSPHLLASVEPPGLQVTGLLPASHFKNWHEAFMAAIAEFPAYEPS